jgi:hypothetical protein
MKPVRTVLPVILTVCAFMLMAYSLPVTAFAGTVNGQVMINATTPMAKGVVLLYSSFTGPPPSPYKYWRIPDQVFPSDSSGKFSLNLAPGDWYMMVAQKKQDAEIGPPLESEFLYFHADEAGNAKAIQVTDTGVVDLGKLTGTIAWLPAMSEREKGITSIEGTVRTVDGKPVQSLVVLAFYTPETRRRPAFVSDRTDKDGRFLIRVAEGGDYWLKVRGVIGGGAPSTGEFQNATDDFEPFMVSLENGQKLKGVILAVKEFTGIGSSGQYKPEKVWKRVDDLNVKPQQSEPPADRKKSGR